MSIVSKKLLSIAGLTAFGLSFSLVACDDSSSAKAEDVPESSSAVQESSSSAEPESSSGTVPESSSEPEACENEGAIDSLMNGNAKYGYTYTYYKCEQGKWIERPEWVTCDTAGVSEGDLCQLHSSVSGFQFGSDVWTCYKYAGEGTWNKTDCPADQDKKCDVESEGLLDSSWSGNNPKYGEMMYYRCESGSWVERDQWVTCDIEGVAKGDTCRKIEHKGFFYQYPKERVFVYEGDGTWKELPREQPKNDFPDCSDFEDGDETLYCPTDEVCDNMKLYVCKDGTWTLSEEQE